MKSKPALITIDVQKGFQDPYWGRRNNPHFERNIQKLLSSWRARGLPLIHVQHLSIEENSPLRPDRPGVDFMDCGLPKEGERIITKSVNSAFIGTELERVLRKEELNLLILAGLTSDHCVSTTARMARNLGFEVVISFDATATFDRLAYDGSLFAAETVHQVSLASLHGEFATVQTTETIIAQLSRLSL